MPKSTFPRIAAPALLILFTGSAGAASSPRTIIAVDREARSALVEVTGPDARTSFAECDVRHGEKVGAAEYTRQVNAGDARCEPFDDFAFDSGDVTVTGLIGRVFAETYGAQTSRWRRDVRLRARFLSWLGVATTVVIPWQMLTLSRPQLRALVRVIHYGYGFPTRLTVHLGAFAGIAAPFVAARPLWQKLKDDDEVQFRVDLMGLAQTLSIPRFPIASHVHFNGSKAR